MQTVTERKAKTEDLVAGYEPRNVFNADETGLFFRMLPMKTLTVRGEKCTCSKMSKERLTLFICANMDGEIEIPIVTGKAACATPFRHLDRNSLPLQWRFNKKAWMTSSIVEEWLHVSSPYLRHLGRGSHTVLSTVCHPTRRCRWLRPSLLLRSSQMQISVRSGQAHVYRSHGIQVPEPHELNNRADYSCVTRVRDTQRAFPLPVVDASPADHVDGHVSCH
jgi:hypothetical protein